MRYGFFNPEGRIESAHNDDTIDALPVGAVGLSDAQWDDRFSLRLVDLELTSDPLPQSKQLPPTAAQTIAAFTSAIQHRLDDFAKARNYDSILSACTYATSSVAKFKEEGLCAIEARDLTWSVGYGIISGIEDGSRSVPTIDEVMAELPVLEWLA